MRAIWTDENKLKIWLQIELLASEALVKQGIVPKADFAKMKRGAAKCFADTKAMTERAKELERTLNHDVIGFTTAVAEQIDGQASRWLHFGLTSSDIVDTCFAVQMVQSADLLIADVKKLLEVLQKLVDKGNTVLTIEHNLDVIKSVDHIIDLGPEGGDAGGEVIAVGTPEQVSNIKESYTAVWLKKLL